MSAVGGGDCGNKGPIVSARIIVADVEAGLSTLDEASVQTVVTSPPYYGMRDYGVQGQIGLEHTFDDFLDRVVAAFRAVRRVLREDGTAWVNMGDSYAMDSKWGGRFGWRHTAERDGAAGFRRRRSTGLKDKDLIGMPWALAFALRADGWWLRSDIIWHKQNPMPESVTDRPTTTHEHLFLLARGPRYYYDADAIMEDVSPNTHARLSQDVAAQIGSDRANGGSRPDRPMKAVVKNGVNPKAETAAAGSKQNPSMSAAISGPVLKRNKRTVWTIPTQGFPDAHFATFPEALVEPCILAGSRRGDLVLDPFAGSGTVGLVAHRLGRDFVGVELNPAYAALAERRLTDDSPLFAGVDVVQGEEIHLHDSLLTGTEVSTERAACAAPDNVGRMANRNPTADEGAAPGERAAMPNSGSPSGESARRPRSVLTGKDPL